MADGLKIGAGWLKKAKQSGEEYYDCTINIKARVMFNKYKKGEKSPDIVIYGYQVEYDKDKGGYKKPQSPPARPQAPATRPPPRQAYVDHTRQTYEPPPSDGTPWPEADDEVPF